MTKLEKIALETVANLFALAVVIGILYVIYYLIKGE